MLTCKEAEKLVMPFIDMQLDDEELEQFLGHIQDCAACREELEIYYTVFLGLRQLDSGTGVYDIAGALGESVHGAWMRVRAVRLRRIICCAVNTLCTVGVLTILFMQLRIWVLGG